MKLLVTGGAGFIGSSFIRTLLKKRTSYDVHNVDKLTYAGNLDNLTEVEASSQYHFHKFDISDAENIERVCVEKKIDAIINFAAESHVDRSIEDSKAFIQSNVVGTHVLLDVARKHGLKRFVQVSTDEVYGSLGETGYFTENTPLAPNSPYAASKTAADLLCRAYVKTYGLDIMVTRCSNNYGPYQYPEKLIPLFILNVLQDKELPLYGDGLYVRDWIHAEDHALALLAVLEEGKAGEIYNIGARTEKRNVDIAHAILDHLKKPHSLLKQVKDRLGHDRRYAIDSSKIEKELGWKPHRSFNDELPALIKWYQENKTWWKKIQNRRSSL